MGRIDDRLAELGLTLPETRPPAGNYVPFAVAGGLIHVSGQVSIGPDGPLTGRLGDGVTVDQGYAGARLCALSILAHARDACEGDLDRIARVVRLGGFVASAPGFTEQPAVINGASDLMVEIFGDAGRHARAAVGVAALPLGVAVEVDAIFAL